MHAALNIDIPNYANTVVTATEVVDFEVRFSYYVEHYLAYPSQKFRAKAGKPSYLVEVLIQEDA